MDRRNIRLRPTLRVYSTSGNISEATGDIVRSRVAIYYDKDIGRLYKLRDSYRLQTTTRSTPRNRIHEFERCIVDEYALMKGVYF